MQENPIDSKRMGKRDWRKLIDDRVPAPSDPSAVLHSYLPDGPSDSRESDMAQLKTINRKGVFSSSSILW